MIQYLRYLLYLKYCIMILPFMSVIQIRLANNTYCFPENCFYHLIYYSQC